MRRHAPLVLLAVCCAGTVRADPPRCYVASRSVLLRFDVGDGAPVERVEAWVTTDEGDAWRPAQVTRDGPRAVRYHAPADGTYGFFLMLVNASGRSGPPPKPATPPQVVVVVDTAPPVVQIHGARPLPARTGGGAALRLDVSLIEEHLGSGGVRVFYRAGEDRPADAAAAKAAPRAWQDAGIVPLAGDVIEWHARGPLPPVVDLRLVATDLAGNQGSDEILGVPTSAAPLPSPQLGGQPPPAGQYSQFLGASRPRLAHQPGPSAPAPPGEVREGVPANSGCEKGFSHQRTSAPSRSRLGRQPASQLRGQPPPAGPPADPLGRDRVRARGLQQQAARFLAQGKLALAGARLEEALRLVPDDPDLYVDLGGVFLRNRQVADAERALRRALELAPDHARALERLALVEALQNRYANARAHLKHLLRVEPRVGRHWLHLGDVEHMLGHATEARDAWRHALRCEPKNATLRRKAEKRLALFGSPAPKPRGLAAAGGTDHHAPDQTGHQDAAADRRHFRR